MNENVFRPSKSMGQNFLTDDNISRKIVKLSGIDKTCSVLEVGPGRGALTKHLAEAADHVTAVELDSRLAGQLQEDFSMHRNVTIIRADILKTDINSLAEETHLQKHRHVCANLPYYITTPVIAKLLDSNVFETITVMVQKEVAQRICASPGNSDYGAFTVYINYHTHPEILFDIPPECFSPRPKVRSSVVQMKVQKKRLQDIRELSTEEEKQLRCVIRSAFNQRRKTLVNALYATFSSTHSKKVLTEAILSCGFDAKIRGEMLSAEEFVRLSAALNTQ